MAYAGEGGATLVHQRLFLTEAWVGDEVYAEQRQRCGVPAEIATFRTSTAGSDDANRTGDRGFAAGALGDLRRGP